MKTLINSAEIKCLSKILGTLLSAIVCTARKESESEMMTRRNSAKLVTTVVMGRGVMMTLRTTGKSQWRMQPGKDVDGRNE